MQQRSGFRHLLYGLGVIFVLGGAGVDPVSADTSKEDAAFERAAAAFRDGDYQTAVREWTALAETGDAVAQHDLGIMYQNGRGVTQDIAQAAKWYRLAAELDYRAAQYYLGTLYVTGQGVEQDDAKGVEWLRKAAQQGHLLAQYNMGVMLNAGKGVAQNLVQAHMWFSLAATRLPPGINHDMAQGNIQIIEPEMSEAQIAEARRLADEWQPTVRQRK